MAQRSRIGGLLQSATPWKAPRRSGSLLLAAPDVACVRLSIVNAYLVGSRQAGDRGWVLVDAGLRTSAAKIRRAAAQRFGAGARPSAIILTHGHFDHVGALHTLADEWDAPIFAHEWELPYLTGRSSYPPPDPAVGGGAMAMLSRFYPRGPYDFRPRVQPLPAGGRVPELDDWRWIHTPGHTPGHVSLFRERDRTLLAGDAFVTTRQESALASLTQVPVVHGPPAYFTPDWEAAGRSVRILAELEPQVAATGHGVPLYGSHMRRQLHRLADTFEQTAVPKYGRYVEAPAVADRNGVVAVPPPVPDPHVWIAAGVGLAALVGVRLLRRRTERDYLPRR